MGAYAGSKTANFLKPISLLLGSNNWKQTVHSDASFSGEIISDNEIEFDHIRQPYSKDGDTEIGNIRIVIKEYNRRKGDQSLYDVRDL